MFHLVAWSLPQFSRNLFNKPFNRWIVWVKSNIQSALFCKVTAPICLLDTPPTSPHTKNLRALVIAIYAAPSTVCTAFSLIYDPWNKKGRHAHLWRNCCLHPWTSFEANCRLDNGTHILSSWDYITWVVMTSYETDTQTGLDGGYFIPSVIHGHPYKVVHFDATCVQR